MGSLRPSPSLSLVSLPQSCLPEICRKRFNHLQGVAATMYLHLDQRVPSFGNCNEASLLRLAQGGLHFNSHLLQNAIWCLSGLGLCDIESAQHLENLMIASPLVVNSIY